MINKNFRGRKWGISEDCIKIRDDILISNCYLCNLCSYSCFYVILWDKALKIIKIGAKLNITSIIGTTTSIIFPQVYLLFLFSFSKLYLFVNSIFWQNAWSGGYIAGTSIGNLAVAATRKVKEEFLWYPYTLVSYTNTQSTTHSKFPCIYDC